MMPSPLNLLSYFRPHTDSYNLTLAGVEADSANAGGREKARQLPVSDLDRHLDGQARPDLSQLSLEANNFHRTASPSHAIGPFHRSSLRETSETSTEEELVRQIVLCSSEIGDENEPPGICFWVKANCSPRIL
ncbi:hypothetical protein SLE2022_159010 [Rubroshorea leprosula]